MGVEDFLPLCLVPQSTDFWEMIVPGVGEFLAKERQAARRAEAKRKALSFMRHLESEFANGAQKAHRVGNSVATKEQVAKFRIQHQPRETHRAKTKALRVRKGLIP